jgi:hypothetical protein
MEHPAGPAVFQSSAFRLFVRWCAVPWSRGPVVRLPDGLKVTEDVP